MQTVVIVIHLMIVIAMIAVILLQRSEGGALGIGGGGGGNLFSARGSANLLTRTTTILAIAFFITSLGLALIAKQQTGAPSLLDGVAPAGTGAPVGDGTRGSGDGLLDLLEGQSGITTPAPPTDDGPTATIDTAPAAPAAPQAPTGN